MRRADLAAGFVALGFGALAAIEARRIPDPDVDVLGPNAFPFVLGLILAACGAAMLVPAVLADARTRQESARWGALAAALGLLLAYAHSLEWIGFALATALFVPASLALLGGKDWGRLALAGIVLSLVMYLGFGRLLGIDLPGGRLFAGW